MNRCKAIQVVVVINDVGACASLVLPHHAQCPRFVSPNWLKRQIRTARRVGAFPAPDWLDDDEALALQQTSCESANDVAASG